MITGVADGDMDYSNEVLKPCLRNYPKVINL